MFSFVSVNVKLEAMNMMKLYALHKTYLPLKLRWLWWEVGVWWLW